MPYNDVNTNLEDLKSGFNLSDEVSGTLFDYDTSADKNLWGSFSGNKSLIQDTLTMNNAKINQSGKGFQSMGAKTELKKTLSDTANSQVGMQLDDTMYGQYKNKNKWLDENMAIISDSILAGDTTVDTNPYNENGGGDGDGDSNPSGYGDGTPSIGETYRDNNNIDWVFGSTGWVEVDTYNDQSDDDYGYSDVRLKKDINYLFTMNNGVPIYNFKYKWSDDVSIGTMAQDIEDMIPEAVSHDSNGYKIVNYSKVFNYAS
jgi:hypothetical protein